MDRGAEGRGEGVGRRRAETKKLKLLPLLSPIHLPIAASIPPLVVPFCLPTPLHGEGGVLAPPRVEGGEDPAQFGWEPIFIDAARELGRIDIWIRRSTKDRLLRHSPDTPPLAAAGFSSLLCGTHKECLRGASFVLQGATSSKQSPSSKVDQPPGCCDAPLFFIWAFKRTNPCCTSHSPLQFDNTECLRLAHGLMSRLAPEHFRHLEAPLSPIRLRKAEVLKVTEAIVGRWPSRRGDQCMAAVPRLERSESVDASHSEARLEGGKVEDLCSTLRHGNIIAGRWRLGDALLPSKREMQCLLVGTLPRLRQLLPKMDMTTTLFTLLTTLYAANVDVELGSFTLLVTIFASHGFFLPPLREKLIYFIGTLFLTICASIPKGSPKTTMERVLALIVGTTALVMVAFTTSPAVGTPFFLKVSCANLLLPISKDLLTVGSVRGLSIYGGAGIRNRISDRTESDIPATLTAISSDPLTDVLVLGLSDDETGNSVPSPS
ncbi:hypothetical protein BDK51DRAFT_43752 [Blyttiomyces helicus]|uniref:Uncharacterized protein n=1 Tax=Blyttiomyces helicus TaxID=388810 RepID=A0A4P9WCF6_9FUNG|nr:hypothetical protein BDK51DRAFT_43752 [Blyttiomyces helicus]|eukprot:RKO90339.1 hypothetical protein BDK51DRAFT_43752 [Blyttiomyces helicus]